MEQYKDIIKQVFLKGHQREDRTGTGTLSTFATNFSHNLSEGFPLVTSKRTYFKGVLYELIWFLNGDTNIKFLVDNGVNIWNDDAYRYYKNSVGGPLTKEGFLECVCKGRVEGYYTYGDLGPVYGKQWRDWSGIDQIQQVIDTIRDNPTSRRIILSGWNVGEMSDMALPPCHSFCQFYVEDGTLHTHLYQRSADVFLGVPFNIASYALLTHFIAHITNKEVGELHITFGDTHLYKNHVESAKDLLLKRDIYPLPTLELGVLPPDLKNIDPAQVNIVGYKSNPPMKVDLSVGL